MSWDTDQSDRFPYPEEIDLPEELEGWAEMYPSYYHFNRSEARSAYEKSLWWVHDLATTDPIRPWDATVSVDAWQTGWAQNTSRVLPIPSAMSVEIRLIAGYAYTAGTVCEDAGLVAEREELFTDRFDHWVANFEELYEGKWKPAVKGLSEEVRTIDVPSELPRYASDQTVKEAEGQVPIVDVLAAYDRLVELALEAWQRHFEFLTFSYLVYAEFTEFCKETFPEIPDTDISAMVAASDADVYRPDRELNRLSRLAVDLGEDVTDVLLSDSPPVVRLAELRSVEGGERFVSEFEEIEDPWFYMSNGDGFHSYHGSWVDDYQTPIRSIAGKIERLQRGEPLDPTGPARADEAERLFEEYLSELDDEAEREEFGRHFERCREIYYYAEDHNFWIDHRFNTLVFRKMREFGELLENHELIDDVEDVFLFTRYEVEEMLEELLHTWALGPTGFVPSHWKQLASRRSRIMEAAKDWDPVPAIGEPPETVEDPVLEMLNGVTEEKIDEWLDRGASSEDGTRIEGLAGSEGTVEGTARIILDVRGLDRLGRGEILIAPLIGPSWVPAFDKAAGIVTDQGGMSSHAAVVCREYGIPAVVCAERATEDVQDGATVRIDGSNGTLEVLSEAD